LKNSFQITPSRRAFAMQHAHAGWRDQVAKATLLPPFRVLLADGLALGALRDRAFSLFLDAFFAKTASFAFVNLLSSDRFRLLDPFKLVL